MDLAAFRAQHIEDEFTAYIREYSAKIAAFPKLLMECVTDPASLQEFDALRKRAESHADKAEAVREKVGNFIRACDQKYGLGETKVKELLERLLDYTDGLDHLDFPDQDVINCVLRDRTLYLDKSWNVQTIGRHRSYIAGFDRPESEKNIITRGSGSRISRRLPGSSRPSTGTSSASSSSSTTGGTWAPMRSGTGSSG